MTQRRQKRIKLLPLFIFIILSACTKQKKEKIILRYCSWESAESMKWHKEYFTAFNLQNPTIEVVLDNVVGEHSAKLLTEIAGGRPPDVTLISETCPDFIAKGAFLPLDDYIKKDKMNLKKFPKQLLIPFAHQEQLYALPVDWNPLILFYNTNLFNRAKMKYPDETWSWEDLLDAAKKLTVKKETGEVISYGLWPGNWLETWIILTRLKNGILYDKERNRWFVNTKEAVDALQFLTDLIYKYKVSPTPQRAKEEPLFELGRIAISIEGAYRVGWYGRIKNFVWNIAPLPKLGNKRLTLIFVGGLAILKGSKHPKEAWEWVKFRSSEQILNLHCSRTFLLPANMELLSKKKFINPQVKSQEINYDTIIDTIKYGETFPITLRFREVYKILQEDLFLALTGERTPKEVCDRAQSKIDKLF